MTCKLYEKFQKGRMGESEYRLHEQDCPVCRASRIRDEELLAGCRKLRIPVDTSGIWDSLEARLKSDTGSDPGAGTNRIPFIPFSLTPALRAALLFLGVCLLGLWIWISVEKPSSGLLSNQALNRVQETEQAYIAAIEELEKRAVPRLETMDMELALLYRDRLETIDEQIRHCRNALKSNPANHQVRRYLLAALLDKNETLREILVEKNESHGLGNRG